MEDKPSPKRTKASNRYRKPWLANVPAISEEDSQGKVSSEVSPRGPVINEILLQGKITPKDDLTDDQTQPLETQ